LAAAPLALEPAALLEPVERRVERARLDPQQVLGLSPDRLADAVAVPRPPLERPEDEHVEGTLEELQAPVVGRLGHSGRQSTVLDVERLRLVPWRSWKPSRKGETLRLSEVGGSTPNGYPQNAHSSRVIASIRRDVFSGHHEAS